MKRDLDLIRNILLDIEQNVSFVCEEYNYVFRHPYKDAVAKDAVANALFLMTDSGLIEADVEGTHDSHQADWYSDVRLTWKGHDFHDSVRDDEIWRKTKEGAKSAGGFTFDLVKALAKGFVKKKIQDNTGIELEL